MLTPPGAPSALPPRGATPAARQSRFRGVCSGARCVALVGALVAAACGDSAGKGAGTAEQVKAVHDRCVFEMVRSTCRVINDKSDLPTSDVVLVAGVGRVDAHAYRALRAAGEGMCSQVQASCGSAWDGAPCRTARALWGGPEHKPQ